MFFLNFLLNCIKILQILQILQILHYNMKQFNKFRKFIKKYKETIFEWNKTLSFREDEKRESFAFIRWNEEK